MLKFSPSVVVRELGRPVVQVTPVEQLNPLLGVGIVFRLRRAAPSLCEGHRGRDRAHRDRHDELEGGQARPTGMAVHPRMINDSGTTARNLLHSDCRIAMIPADINMPLSPDRLRDALTGVIGFPVTPFHPDLSVDFEALRANLRVMLASPLAAIVAAGGTGELYSSQPLNTSRWSKPWSRNRAAGCR